MRASARYSSMSPVKISCYNSAVFYWNRVMHIKIRSRYCCLLALLVVFGVAAQQGPDAAAAADTFVTEPQEPELGPYEARIVVDSQSEPVRLRAMSAGLQQVIVNLLGNDDALFEPEISRALRAPQQYVMQFSYRKGLVEDEQQTFLKLRFLQRRVDNLLRAANQVEAGELQSIEIEVQGVTDFAAYASTLTALQALAMVREVSPVIVQARRVEFSVQFEGDVEQLTAAMMEQTQLQALDNSIDPVFADRLSYELR